MNQPPVYRLPIRGIFDCLEHQYLEFPNRSPITEGGSARR